MTTFTWIATQWKYRKVDAVIHSVAILMTLYAFIMVAVTMLAQYGSVSNSAAQTVHSTEEQYLQDQITSTQKDMETEHLNQGLRDKQVDDLRAEVNSLQIQVGILGAQLAEIHTLIWSGFVPLLLLTIDMMMRWVEKYKRNNREDK